MKWLITILTIVLNTTGFMLETPDPCDSSPNSCDSEPVIKVPIPDTPKMEATSGVDSISVSWSGSTRAEAYYSVVGYNKTGPSSMSAAASATPIPKAPARISATLGTGPNTITWESTNGATGGYTLCYSPSTPVTTSDNASAVSAALPTRTRAWQGANQFTTPSRLQRWGGHSALSSETSSTPDPTTPTGIAAVAVTEEKAISWNSVAGATGYT